MISSATIRAIKTTDDIEDENPGFEILHLSFRKKLSPDTFGGPVEYYLGNIVFRLTDEYTKNRMDSYLKEYEPVRMAESQEALTEYYESAANNFRDFFSDKDRPPSPYISGYRLNMSPLNNFVEYIEKFDCYYMREYYQDTPVVRGIIEYLTYMKDGGKNTTRNCYSEQFLSTLENLCWWWD